MPPEDFQEELRLLVSGCDDIATALADAQDPSSSDFIGPPPVEIASLVKKTSDRAQACASADSSDVMAALGGGDKLMPVLKAWKPYGVTFG